MNKKLGFIIYLLSMAVLFTACPGNDEPEEDYNLFLLSLLTPSPGGNGSATINATTNLSCGDAVRLTNLPAANTATAYTLPVSLLPGQHARFRVTNTSGISHAWFFSIGSMGVGDDMNISAHALNTSGPSSFASYLYVSNNVGVDTLTPSAMAAGDFRDVCIYAFSCSGICTGTIFVF